MLVSSVLMVRRANYNVAPILVQVLDMRIAWQLQRAHRPPTMYTDRLNNQDPSRGRSVSRLAQILAGRRIVSNVASRDAIIDTRHGSRVKHRESVSAPFPTTHGGEP